MDKAPDAFRTISEVADDLDIPQHVLRFWETRFTQIKPMKRSGGRRYYRPDDVDLLRGIRRLLYGEGYTIRGVQRILREQGIKSVQGLVDGSVAAPAFAPSDEASMPADDVDDEPNIDAGDEEDAEMAPAQLRRAPAFAAPSPRPEPAIPPKPAPSVALSAEVVARRKLDATRLETALQELIACRQLLDSALKEG